MPDPTRDIILETDGSRIALGEVLKHNFDDTGLEHPVGFFSSSHTGSDWNYVAYELEMYAVVFSIKHFRMFLLKKEFLLRIDHSALRNRLRRDLPLTTRVEQRCYDILKIPSESSINEDKTTVLRMYSQDFRSLLEISAAQPQFQLQSRTPEH